ncbi:Sorting and assembly machinery component 50-like protein [Quillaja saponaria]|uniref:Sorting and assembly machinery component 50-like protein n=1 Tax=Quillaja saponaria TaxID=32244 RepID=A0AAD7LM97_QUISA|nr:Sorting and assembly machinery component 50-like protein [Quillaja saponaria]
MGSSVGANQAPIPPNPENDSENHEPSNVEGAEDQDNGDEEDEINDAEEIQVEDEYELKQRKSQTQESRLREQKFNLENLLRRMSSERVPLRVHDVLIKGNTKTKDSLIEAELEGVKNAKTMQELLQAASIANAKLQRLEIFDSVNITLDSGPTELPGTANVIVEVAEAKSPLTGEVGMFRKTTARSWVFEGALKYKNRLGYGDLWDGSLAVGPHQTSEAGVGVFLPRVKGLVTPVVARVSLLSLDWIEFSSYKERLLGLSLGLFSTQHHDLVYNLGWRTLTDPSQMASRSIRRQLGHGLLSSLKYTYKLDRRDSPLRPTRGYAFLSSTQVGGLVPDHRSLQFLRQEFDLRYAVPLGFYQTALNIGISSGVVFPWGHGFLNKRSPLPERFFLGGDFSPVCNLGGPSTVWGFKTRGLGPSEPRRQTRDNSNDDNSGRDYVGGDLVVTAFADLSFDLPVKWLRENGVHGHVFAGAGNVAKLTEGEFRNFSFHNFLQSFRSSVGVGVVIPTKLFRLEGNYYYILKQHDHDRGKSGFRFSFSPPS